jgi:hypothetical protein
LTDSIVLLKPRTVDLEHRAYFLRSSAGAPFIVAGSTDGFVSVVDSQFGIGTTRVAPQIRALSPHPFDSGVAWVNGKGTLMVQRSGDARQVEIAPPPTRPGTSTYIPDGFQDCFFDENGTQLWLVAHLGDEDVEVTLVDIQSWRATHKFVVPDPFQESSCSFHSTNVPGRISMWMAAGQNGQQVFWLNSVDDQVSCDQELKLENTTPPVFCSEGSHFLVSDECNQLCQYEFSTGRKLGASIKPVGADNWFAESVCWLDNGRAIAATNEGRVYLIDTNRMRIVEEVVIEGHEPQPVSEYYPGLKGNELVTDILWFTQLAVGVAFVVRRDRGVGLEGWKDSLLVCET